MKRALTGALTLAVLASTLTLPAAAYSREDPPTLEESRSHCSIQISHTEYRDNKAFPLYEKVEIEPGSSGYYIVYSDTMFGANCVNPAATYTISNTAPAGTDCYVQIYLDRYSWTEGFLVDEEPTDGYLSQYIGTSVLTDNGFVSVLENPEEGTVISLEPGQSHTLTLDGCKAGDYVVLAAGVIYPGCGYDESSPDLYWYANEFLYLDSSIPVGETQPQPETNAPSDWAQTGVTAAVEAGLVPAAITGNPGYQDTLTREQFAELIVQTMTALLGEELPAAAEGFSDTTNPAVLQAVETGVVGGVGGGKFAPTATTNREQVATMMARAIAYLEEKSGLKLTPNAGSVESYTDKNAVSDWAAESMGLLAANGIMEGSGGALSPQNPCTLEQCILLCYRICQQYQELAG